MNLTTAQLRRIDARMKEGDQLAFKQAISILFSEVIAKSQHEDNMAQLDRDFLWDDANWGDSQ